MLRRWFADRYVSLCRSQFAATSPNPRWPSPANFFHTHDGLRADIIPLRKQLKEEIRVARSTARSSQNDEAKARHDPLNQWELTVGIEIHAQLNTGSKLFSQASAEYTDVPNAASWPFDLAVPGSQPIFQPQILIPALRAAIALNCEIQTRSKFDRKHYFYHDQPAGYQITQYYEPFARNGQLRLTRQDGLRKDDGELVEVGIKQIQLEQDTAKTQEQDEQISLIDFNRSGHALIEIISLPQIHSPSAAASYVRKIQSILYAVDAATTGMELGGLRADVNVSVRRRNDTSAGLSYSGVHSLGQRTEIKNLSSFKSVEDAVTAERDRQIDLLEAGGTVDGETRGWSLANPGSTRRLRGKEGEVDYRYMPDPDLPPLYIGNDVVERLRHNLPPVPDQLLDMLGTVYGLTVEDARAMLSLDDGARLLYYQDVIARLKVPGGDAKRHGVHVGNWVLHELGALLSMSDIRWTPDLISSEHMADLMALQITGKLTGLSAKRLLRILFNGEKASVAEIAKRENLLFITMEQHEYDALADQVIALHAAECEVIRQGGKQAKGKLKFLLGQMMRSGDRNRIEAQRAETTLQSKLLSHTTA